MKEQIIKLIKEENLTSAKFAEVIGVQPSSISHILSGRNKPSYDFILKILSGFPDLNAEWLLQNKGVMYKSNKQPALFDDNTLSDPDLKENKKESDRTANIHEKKIEFDEIMDSKDVISKTNNSEQVVEKIVVLYSDKTFFEYKPR